MRKEKHPVYRFILGGLILVLLLGIALLVMGLVRGPEHFFSPYIMSI